MSIIWLSSYPKSGNTWLRAFLTNYCDKSGGTAFINALIGSPIAMSRDLFDQYLGLKSSDMTWNEVMAHRPLFHRLLAEELTRPTFIKTHDAYVHTPAGEALFPKTTGIRVVYLVRNPLDVAVSFAHHGAMDIDQTIKLMNNVENCSPMNSNWIYPHFPPILLCWCGHVSSWLDQTEIPILTVRYEDMQADPTASFGEIVRFAGLEWDSKRLAHAIDDSAFKRLRTQEEDCGFREKQPTSASFFRAGMTGSWRTSLSKRQVRTLLDAHHVEMARLGYLEEANVFLPGTSR